MHKIDLNADLGEGGGMDERLMSLASSVNIACGGHAGDEASVKCAVELAIQSQVAIGAHPGFEDPANFGRLPLKISSDQIRSLIHRQLGRILAIHPHLHHVKPHGALYNQSNQDEAMAAALVNAIAEIQPNTILYCPPHGELARAAAEVRLATCAEGFIDRRYLEDGNLCPRTQARALIEDASEALEQTLQIATRQRVTTIKGATIPLMARTLCVHGDNPNAIELLRLTRSTLEKADIEIISP